MKVVKKAAFLKAVDDFLAGRWAPSTYRFIYATSAEAVRTELADSISEKAVELAALGIDLVVWDRERLSEILRFEHPQLVDDFFGRSWAEAVLPPEVVAGFGARLDGARVAQLRSALADVYAAAFGVTDSGSALIGRAAIPPTSVADRFVVPDLVAGGVLDQVADRAGNNRARHRDGSPYPGAEQRAQMSSLNLDASHQTDRQTGDYTAPAGFERRFVSKSGDWYQPRPVLQVGNSSLGRIGARRATEWLATDDRQLVIGEPGAGKSTLLRFVVLDLLTDEPRWTEVAQRWGDRLPVWLPFHFYTQRVGGRTGRDASILEAIRAWFDQHDVGHLMDLVTAALKDDRLLLVVDGLDEWADPSAGEYAAAALETFVQRLSSAMLLSARPYALDRINLSGAWQVAHLANLSVEQQRALATPYFETATTSTVGATATGDTGSDDRALVAQRAVETFIAEVTESPDLRRLAATPLFLVLLVGISLSTRARLPQRRFEVFKRAIDLLISEHPSQRRVAAGVTITVRRLDDRQFRLVLQHVAFAAQVRGDLRAIDRQQLRRDVTDALMDQDVLAMPRSEATPMADELLNVAEGDLGLLVRLSPTDVGFIHRTLHEQLAAEHVAANLTESVRDNLLTTRVGDLRWREVILGCLWSMDRPSDRRRVGDIVRDMSGPTPNGVAAAELLSEMVFGPYNLPGDQVRDLGACLIEKVETEPLLSHRAVLLSRIVQAADNIVLKADVEDRIARWGISSAPPTRTLVGNLALPPVQQGTQREADQTGPGAPGHSADPSPGDKPAAPLSGATRDDDPDPIAEVLFESLRQLESDVAWAGAEHLVQYSRDHGRPEYIRVEMCAHLANPVGPTGAAAALAVLAAVWPGHPDTTALIRHYRGSHSVPIRTVVLAHLIGILEDGLVGRLPDSGSGAANRMDLEELASDEVAWLQSLIFRNRWTSTTHEGVHLAAVVASVIGREGARDFLIERIRDGRGADMDAVWKVAIGAFGHDPVFVDFVADLVATGNERLPTLSMPFGGVVLTAAYQEPSAAKQQMAAAIEVRLEHAERTPMDLELFHLAQIDQGPIMKESLIAQFESSGTPHWAAGALAQHFLDDTAVAELLTRRLRSDDSVEASRVSTAAQTVLGPEAGRDRLLEMLTDLAGKGVEQASSRLDPGLARFDMIAGALANCLTEASLPERERVCALALPLLPDDRDSWYGSARLEFALKTSDCRPSQAFLADVRTASPEKHLEALLAVTVSADQRADLISRAKHRLRTLPASQRVVLNHVLASGVAAPALVMRACADWSDEVDDVVRSAASLAFHRALLAAHQSGEVDQLAYDAAVDHLVSEASSYGPIHEARRRAAWIGLCVLGRWDAVDAKVETIGDPAPVAVALGGVIDEPDAVLTDQIARNWVSLRAHFGETLTTRLSGIRNEDAHGMWDRLAPIAAHYPALDADLRAAVQADPVLLRRERVLAWYITHVAPDPSSASAALIAATLAADGYKARELAAILTSEALGSHLELRQVRDAVLDRVEHARAAGAPLTHALVECLAILDPEHEIITGAWSSMATELRREPNEVARDTNVVHAGGPDEVAPTGPSAGGKPARATPTLGGQSASVWDAAMRHQRQLLQAPSHCAIAYAKAGTSDLVGVVIRHLQVIADTDVSVFDDAFVAHLRRRLLAHPDAARVLIDCAADPDTPVELAVRLVSLATLAPGRTGFKDLVDSVLTRLDGPSVLLKDPLLQAIVPARVALLHAATT